MGTLSGRAVSVDALNGELSAKTLLGISFDLLSLTGISALVLLGLSAALHAQGWEIPSGASNERSPLSATPVILAKGRALYVANCARCHGSEGKGDGPDTVNDLAHRPADLTDAFRARFNPEGMVFYRIWNGRTQPTMPAFKTKLTRSDVWAIVEYVKTLRKAPSQ
jgi:mono/diheme cytochrome c family protein